MSYAYINNQLSIPARLLYDEWGVMGYKNYQAKCTRGKLKRTKEGRGAGNEAYVAFDSLSPTLRMLCVEKLGKPEDASKYRFTEFISHDFKAQSYYAEYTLSDNNHLPRKTQKEYVTHANILNTCALLLNNTNALRLATSGIKIKGIWDVFAEIIEELNRDTYPHSLPSNSRSLRNKYNKYKKEGYDSLIHGNFLNTNSEKLTEESKFWILAKWNNMVERVVSIPHMHTLYNEEAKKQGWKAVSEEKTIYNFLNDEEIKPLWWANRYGEQAYKVKYVFQLSTKMPTMRDSLWYSDGTKLNYYYLEDGKMKTCQVYEVMDAFSEVMLGFHISPTENTEAQFNAYKMAIQISGHRPYQIGMDNQGGHKKMESGNFLSKIARLRIATQPYNGKSKTIESAFGRFQMQHLKKDWFFTGQNITTKRNESKANMEFILENKANLPTLDEIKSTYEKRRKEWNAAAHHRTKQPRIDMYLNSVNPETPEVIMWDMVELFWMERPQTVKLSAYGLTFKESKVKHTYMKYTEDQMPDIEWLEKNIDKSFTIKYDPSDLSLIYIYENTPLGLRFVSEMLPKVEVSRGIQEQEKYEASYIQQILEESRKQRIARRDEVDELLEAHDLHPEQNGLNSPRISGLETKKRKKQDTAAPRKKKAKAVKVESIGQYQKELSNVTEIDLRKLIKKL